MCFLGDDDSGWQHKEVKELLMQFDKSLSANNKHNPKSSSWFNKVKKFFEDMKF